MMRDCKDWWGDSNSSREVDMGQGGFDKTTE